MKNIYGTIGYTVLEYPKTGNKLLVLADMHDTLQDCVNKTNISDWFKSKFKSSQILLEEVPRENFELGELWSKSQHTQQLKNLFLNNKKIIHPVDIRPFLIPFSWEIFGMGNLTEPINKQSYNITLLKYLKRMNNFFSLKEPYLLTKLSNYRVENLAHTKLGKHFLKIKKKYHLLLLENKSKLKFSIVELYGTHIRLLENINDLLDEIMEWYICACVDLYKHRPVIIHTGLAHSEKIVDWLINYYNFKFINKIGVNKLSEVNGVNLSNVNGCV